MLSVKHLIDTYSLTADDITQILDTAKSFDPIVNARTIKKVPALRGRTIVNLFLEPSTRTLKSFELAEKRLSADSISMGGSTSSVVKGESLADTIQTIDAMNVDMFVVRARLAGTPQVITQNTDAIVINGGDGKHQHPTQAMLDLYTIREHFGHLDGLKVAIVGDLAHSRVCGSLAPALKTMGADVTLVAPPTFQVGDRLLITGPTTGVIYVTADEIHDDDGPVQVAQQGTRVSIAVPSKVRPSDKLFKLVNDNGND